MAKRVELRRHTAADGDRLTPEGVRDALDLGSRLTGAYDMAISSGAQRATQTLACLLAGAGAKVDGGVVVDARFKSEIEDRWKAAYDSAGAGDIASFLRVDPDLVEKEAAIMGGALRACFDGLPEGGRALIVGHSPMQEVAVYGLTGEVVEPLSKGSGVVVTEEDGNYRLEPAG
ncbi:MAG: histidine phosphatase family protein [Actinomycetota bacterium]|nr:histidine phosphatase family protein [Actinomycetota bacterium]